MQHFKPLEKTVYPSEEKTIFVEECNEYGGAHLYDFKNSVGFNNGRAEYVDSTQAVQFVKKESDGSIVPGLQSEQLVIALLDRAVKLNNRFPSPQNEKMIQGLEMFLEACEERVKDRVDRGVMGNLKK